MLIIIPYVLGKSDMLGLEVLSVPSDQQDVHEA